MKLNRISTFVPFRFRRLGNVYTKASSSVLGLLLCAFVAAAHFNAAATEVYFSATINQSPLTTAGYNVGSTVTGTFDYTPGAAPTVTGPNYTEYRNSGTMQVSFGAAQYNSTFGEIDADHDIGFNQIPSPLDVYSVYGYSLAGPSVQGFGPSDAQLHLIDTDHSIYTTTPPYPIDLPNPALFEINMFTVQFSTNNVDCTLNSIYIVPEPTTFHLLMTSALSAMVIAYRKRQQQR